MKANSMLRQILHFVIHLRLHYQFLILSGAYLLAALFVEKINPQQFWMQCLNVHVLLFGGATAYNSWWDKDEGPIGGLKNPPKMEPWMWPASLFMQFLGVLWAFSVAWQFATVYALSMLLFWLYSSPLARWKGKPVLSLIAIGVSTGTNSFLMGIIAAGTEAISGIHLGVALGVACIILSLYPASQIYQSDEDEKRGDQTFAIRFGLMGVKTLYFALFALGSAIISVGLYYVHNTLGIAFGGVSLLAFLVIGLSILKLTGEPKEYGRVMKMKFLASFSFVVFILATIALQKIAL